MLHVHVYKKYKSVYHSAILSKIYNYISMLYFIFNLRIFFITKKTRLISLFYKFVSLKLKQNIFVTDIYISQYVILLEYFLWKIYSGFGYEGVPLTDH